jgi:hypothetical protein
MPTRREGGGRVPVLEGDGLAFGRQALGAAVRLSLVGGVLANDDIGGHDAGGRMVAKAGDMMAQTSLNGQAG